MRSTHVSPDHRLGQQGSGIYQVAGGVGRLFQIEKAGRSCVAMTLEQRHEWNGRVSLPRWERTAFQEKRNKNHKGPENGTVNPNTCVTSKGTTLEVYLF